MGSGSSASKPPVETPAQKPYQPPPKEIRISPSATPFPPRGEGYLPSREPDGLPQFIPPKYPPEATCIMPGADDEDLSSISSMSGESQSQGPGNLPSRNLRLRDLGKERDAHDFDFENEFFIWDDVEVNKKEILEQPKNLEFRKPKNLGVRNSAVGEGSGNSGGSAVPKGTVIWSEFQIDPDLEFDQPAIRPTKAMQKQNAASSLALIGKLSSQVKCLKPKRARTGTIADFKLNTFVGHGSRVKCIAVSPAETAFVSCSNEDSIVTYFDTKSKQELGIFSGHTDTVIYSCFSPCGKYIATTSRDNHLILWDVVTMKRLLSFEHAKVVICCALSKDSKFIATGCQDKACRVWETRKGRELLAFTQHEGIIISLSFSPDESHVVSCSADKTLRIWTTAKGKQKHVMRGHQAIILSCQYSVDGKRIVSNDERLTKVWDASSGECLLTLNVEEFVKIRNMPATKKLSWTLSCAAPGKFGDYLVVACNNRFVFVINMITGEEELSVDTKAPVYCLAPGFRNLVVFGDSFGNIYHLELIEFPDLM